MQLVAGLIGTYPDGVLLVELAALTDPSLVPQVVASVLEIKEQPGTSLTQTMIEYLAAKRLLLILDNAEHLLGPCAQLADAILSACAHVVILVTSRERLGITGELTYRVPSLSVPSNEETSTPETVAAYESARLFIERARLQRPHFVVTAENAPPLASICRRLDGIPLAIELAAPRVRSMSVEEVDRRLDQRFGLLAGGSRTALPRHRTLRSMVDWSYNLLSDAEKATLQQVSVFAGGWTLEAAEQVCAGDGVDATEVLDLLTSLADKNLVTAEERDGATRYGLLETVRHYARDQLREIGAEANVQDQHLAYFLALAEKAEAQLQGAEQQTCLDRLETEHDNLRAALGWSVAAGTDVASGLRLAAAVWVFWQAHGYFGEGRGWLSRLLAASGDQPTAARAKALRTTGNLAYCQGDYPAALAMYEDSLATERKRGDRLGISHSLNNLGNVALSQRDYATARPLYEEALAIKKELGDQPSIARVLVNLGLLAHERGDYAGARALHEEALAIHRTLGNRDGVALALLNLGGNACGEGDYAAARALYAQSLAIQRELGNKWVIAALLEGFAAVAAAMTEPGRAARLWGQAEQLREEIGVPLMPHDRPGYDGKIAAARTEMNDEAAFDSAWLDGRAMSLKQAMQYASSETAKTHEPSRPEANS
jgi:non-specific serine/threonine protein kinase